MVRLDSERRKQYLDLMAQRGWDLLLFYGDSWRKDHFRCLVSVCFSGPQAVAMLTREGEIRAVVTHPWDVEPVRSATGGSVTYAPRLVEGLKTLLREAGKAFVAINGLEQMEQKRQEAPQQVCSQACSKPGTGARGLGLWQGGGDGGQAQMRPQRALPKPGS